MPLSRAPTCVVAAELFPLLAIGNRDGSVQLVDVNGLPMEIDESRITEVHGAAVRGAAFNETSQLLCTCGDDCTLHVRDFCNAVVHRFVLNQPILSCAFDILRLFR